MNTRWIRRVLLIVPIIALFLLPILTAQAGTNVLLETFNDNKMDTKLWQTFSIGSGPTIAERNRRLEITLPADCSGDPFFIAYQSRFKMQGNFDIYVDYHLLTWPEHSGVRVGLGSNLSDPPDAVVERTGHGVSDVADGEEVYLIHTTDSLLGYIQTTDRSGKLRLYRNGDLVRAYYYDRAARGWKVIATTNVTTEDVPILLAAWSHDWAFADQNTMVAFDNFTIRLGKMVK